jgi:hypothetical protein
MLLDHSPYTDRYVRSDVLSVLTVPLSHMPVILCVSTFDQVLYDLPIVCCAAFDKALYDFRIVLHVTVVDCILHMYLLVHHTITNTSSVQ